MKKGARILAIDGSAYRKQDADSLIVGVVGREDEVEGVLSFRVQVDGEDSTKMIIRSASRSRFYDQIRLVAVHGVTLAGLNVVDLPSLGRELGIPVVGVVRRRPHAGELEKAVRASGIAVERKLALLRKIRKGSEAFRMEGFYFQAAGITKDELRGVSGSAVRFLRLAHIIANGVARGESRGRI
jgi:hypothetical protein